MKGYFQVEGVEFGDIFSLVVMLGSIRLLKSLVASFDLEIEHVKP